MLCHLELFAILSLYLKILYSRLFICAPMESSLDFPLVIPIACPATIMIASLVCPHSVDPNAKDRFDLAAPKGHLHGVIRQPAEFVT